MHAEELIALAIPATYLVLLALEPRLGGRSFPPTRWWRLRGTGWVVLLLAINAVLPSLLPQDWPARHRLLDLSSLGTAGGALVGYLGVSLAAYWFHRAEHRFLPMWRLLHQLHHSPQRMDLGGAALTSPLETAISVALFVLVTTFVLGITPLAAAVCGYVGAFYSMFQHFNVRTPRWLGYLIERPEAHTLHHARDIHAANYGDLPLWDLVFGTFRNPDRYDGEVGFPSQASRRVGAMLLGVDVNGDQPFGRPAGMPVDALPGVSSGALRAAAAPSSVRG